MTAICPTMGPADDYCCYCVPFRLTRFSSVLRKSAKADADMRRAEGELAGGASASTTTAPPTTAHAGETTSTSAAAGPSTGPPTTATPTSAPSEVSAGAKKRAAAEPEESAEVKKAGSNVVRAHVYGAGAWTPSSVFS